MDWKLLGVVFLLASAGSLRAQARPCEPSTDRLRPSSDLYCVELIPVPELAAARGVVELARTPGPFMAAPTPDGRLRYAPIIHIEGLPDPGTLGAYRTYVAWAATPLMYPMVRLGEVQNGRTRLEPIALNKFVILVSAERSPQAAEREGRIVLRGQSPSTRMTPPDFLEFSVAGVPQGEAQRSSPDGLRWGAVPMPAGLPMLPAMMALRPRTDPYLPTADPNAVPPARPRELVRVADGDTLELEAGFVRRTLGRRTLTMYGFNGQYPGPLIWVDQRSEIVVQFTNNIDWPTTVHWHGLRLDNRFDGVPFVTQEPVAPGHSFEYRLIFPDAGLYWYHPHFREDIQQDLGLYGNIMVRSDRPDYFGPAHREEVLVLDDLLLGDDGLVPYGRGAATHVLMGRFGNIVLVNGEPNYALSVKRDEVVRFFLTNVSNTRTFNLSLPGVRMKVVGSDVGNFQREEWVESIVIAPAERYIVHAQFSTVGEIPLLNSVQGVDHFFGNFRAEVDTLGTVTVTPDTASAEVASAFATLREDPYVNEELAQFEPYFNRPVDKELRLLIETADLPYATLRMMQLDSAYFNPIEWSGNMPMMNFASTTDQVRWILRDPDTGRENVDIDWRFRVGDVVKIRLSNERETLHSMQHPIHLHGQRFLVLSQNGVRNDNLVWKDTVLLPVGSTADILLELSNPGRWMIHCHIAEHIESGMMMVMTVEER